MNEIIGAFNKMVEYYGHTAALIIIMVSAIMYGVFLIVKNNFSSIKSFFEKKWDEKNKEHTQAAIHRKNVTPKIRAELLELASEIKADRALVFEFSNGSSNLVGLPFLFVSATCEVLTPGTSPISQEYQRINTAIVAEFLEKLEDKGYYYVKDIEECKDTCPVLYGFLKPNNAHSVLFYTLYGVNDTIGFVVATTVNNKEFTREDALPRIASSAQIISSLLNFDTLQEKL